MHGTAYTIVLCDLLSLYEASLLSQFSRKLVVYKRHPLGVTFRLVYRDDTSTFRTLDGFALTGAPFRASARFPFFGHFHVPP
jgi:hypothetical protein